MSGVSIATGVSALDILNPSTATAVVGAAGIKKFDLQKFLSTSRAFEKFDRIADWTVSNAANSTATTNSSGRGPYSSNAIRFAASAVGGQSATITKNITFNLNTQNGFWLLTDVHNRQTAAQIGMTLFASHAVDLGGGTGRFQFANPVANSAVSLQPTWVPKSGWSVLDGTPSWSNDMLSWRVRLDSSGSEARDWSVCGAFTGGARPTVIITNDDGWDTSYSIGFAQAQKRGIPLTNYLIASQIGAAGYITLAQAQEMRAAGDYLGMHGIDSWDTDLSAIDRDVAALRALGIDTQHAAYPNGQIGYGTAWRDTEARLAANGVKTARITGGGTPTLRAVGDLLALNSYPLNNTMTLAAAKAAVDLAISSGGTVIFYGHKYGAAADSLTWVTADYTALLDYVAQKRIEGAIDVTTINRWYDAA